ncbi:MAG: SurA N-terminal domain-containing protein [Verrucomicrobia bacterium]|nr:SurA N-terminal domain-containing protein [Verrucomicrobiota bacterium]
MSLLVAAVLRASAAIPTGPYEANRILVLVNDAVVTEKDVRAYIEPNYNTIRRLYGDKPDTFAQRAEGLWRDGIQELVNRQLVLDDFKKSGLVLPESVIDDFISSRIKESYSDRATLAKSLQAEGTTYETFRQNLKDNFIVEQMYLRNISSAVNVSPYKVETYYREQTNDFMVPDQIHLRTIVLLNPNPQDASRLKLAYEIRRKLAEGADFGEMASIYSEGSQRAAKGDWDWVGENNINPGLWAAAKNLAPRKFSGVIGRARLNEKEFWFYDYDDAGNIIHGRKFSEREVPVPNENRTRKTEVLAEERDFKPADATEPVQEFYTVFVEEKRLAHSKPLADVRAEIENTLITRERARLQQRYIERLRKTAFVRYFPD